MRNNYFAFGINHAGTTLVAKPVQPRADPAHVFAPEFFLDDLDRRGMAEFCRIFGHYALDMLRIVHPGTIGRQPLFLPPGTRVISGPPPFTEDSPMERGAMQPGYVAVGVSDKGNAVEIAEFEVDRRLALPRFLPFTELAPLGPDTAATRIGERILIALLRLHPNVFAPFHHLSYQAQKGEDHD
jgi:hypothetical protein